MYSWKEINQILGEDRVQNIKQKYGSLGGRKVYGIAKSIAAAQHKVNVFEVEDLMNQIQNAENKINPDLLTNTHNKNRTAGFLRRGVQRSSNILRRIISMSIRQNGKDKTIEGIINVFGGNYAKELERLALAVIDTKGADAYNTNTVFISRESGGGFAGRSRYRNKIEELVAELEVQMPSIADVV